MDQLLKSGDVDYFPSGVFKTILNEVKTTCSDIDIEVNDQLVSVIIKLLGLDPSHGFHSDGKMDRRSVASIVRKCVDIVNGEEKNL